MLSSMLDNLPMPVMLSDKDFTIIYANKASMEVLRKLAPHLPIPADKAVGSPIGFFSSNAAQPQSLQAQLGNHRHTAEISLGKEWLSFNATPLRNTRGEFDCMFIDWAITTESI